MSYVNCGSSGPSHAPTWIAECKTVKGNIYHSTFGVGDSFTAAKNAAATDMLIQLEAAATSAAHRPQPVPEMQDSQAVFSTTSIMSRLRVSPVKLEFEPQYRHKHRIGDKVLVYIYKHVGEGNLELVGVELNPGPFVRVVVPNDFDVAMVGFKLIKLFSENGETFFDSWLFEHQPKEDRIIVIGLNDVAVSAIPDIGAGVDSVTLQLHPVTFIGDEDEVQEAVNSLNDFANKARSMQLCSYDEWKALNHNKIMHAINGNMSVSYHMCNVCHKPTTFIDDQCQRCVVITEDARRYVTPQVAEPVQISGSSFESYLQKARNRANHALNGNCDSDEGEILVFDCPDCGGDMLKVDEDLFHSLPTCASSNAAQSKPSTSFSDSYRFSSALSSVEPVADSQYDAVMAAKHNALMHAQNGNNQKKGQTVSTKQFTNNKMKKMKKAAKKIRARAKVPGRKVYLGGAPIPKEVKLTIERATAVLRTKGFNDNEVRFIIQMCDPFHDLDLAPGKPPSKTQGMSVVRKITNELTITKPTGLAAGATWGAYICNIPLGVNNVDYFNTGSAAVTVLQDEKSGVSSIMQFTGVDASSISPTTYLGGKDRQCEGTTIRTFAMGTTQSPWVNDNNASVYSNQYFIPYMAAPTGGSGQAVVPPGPHRLCGLAYEVVDQTPRLYTGGSIGVFRQNPALQQGMMVNDAPTPDRQILCNLFRAPPTITNARAKPNWQTWPFPKGAYVVCTPATEVIEPVAFGSKNSIMMGADIGDPTASIKYSIPTQKNGINGGFNLYAGESVTGIVYHDWNYSGTIIEGLNENASFKVRQIAYVEQFVNSSNQSLVTLATPTARDNPEVWKCIDRMLTSKPAGVHLNANYTGEWFINCVESISRHAGPISTWLGLPGVAAAATAVNRAAKAIDNAFR